MSSTPEDKTPERQQLMDRLAFLGQMLSTETAHFHHTAAAKQGLSVTDSKTVSALMQEGPMTAGQLAKRLSLTTGAVTSVIDRLEGQNIVYRITDPKDRRKVVVHANPKKLEECGKVYESIGKAFAKLLSNYSEEQLRFLVEYYEASVEITKDEIAKLHT